MPIDHLIKAKNYLVEQGYHPKDNFKFHKVVELLANYKNGDIANVIESVCSCSKGKGIDHDENGKAYCIDCGNYLEQTVQR